MEGNNNGEETLLVTIEASSTDTVRGSGNEFTAPTTPTPSEQQSSATTSTYDCHLNKS
ncbi:Hypothetical protein FKW44_014946 [Caligus rogercresseyi]|uniref:Uncharacterized protein n=1 Tax=Caligus rogercresseyi TaxID=217165 RepID=A0A7T8H089_CALRO|nr:Hypothetical protein FKW44_014946 [Caligus rogercresseyi]